MDCPAETCPYYQSYQRRVAQLGRRHRLSHAEYHQVSGAKALLLAAWRSGEDKLNPDRFRFTGEVALWLLGMSNREVRA